MATKFWRAGDEVVDLATDIIENHHPHLIGVDILYLFREKASKRKGKLTAGKASKMSAKERAIAQHEYPFKIVFAFDLWTLQNEAWRRALIDHELCHLGGNAEDGWEIVPHDLEEFAQIVERHGLWNQDVQRFVSRTSQLDLFDAAERFRETSKQMVDEYDADAVHIETEDESAQIA